MLKIYGVYRSRATRNLWMAGEIGLDFEHVPVIQAYRLPDPFAPDAPLNTRTPSFMAVNPMGAIPTLEDNGLVLNESMAITLYLAKKYGGDLGPKTVEEDALMTQWSFFCATEIESTALKISTLSAEGKLATDAGREEAEVHARLLRRPFGVLEKHFEANDYAVGARFTAADVNMAEIVRYASPYTVLMDAHPAVSAWLARCQARPAFKAMWEKRLAEPA